MGLGLSGQRWGPALKSRWINKQPRKRKRKYILFTYPIFFSLAWPSFQSQHCTMYDNNSEARPQRSPIDFWYRSFWNECGRVLAVATVLILSWSLLSGGLPDTLQGVRLRARAALFAIVGNSVVKREPSLAWPVGIGRSQ